MMKEAIWNIKNKSTISLSAQSLLDCIDCKQTADMVGDYGLINSYGLYESSAYPWTAKAGKCNVKGMTQKAYQPLQWEITYFQRKSISAEMAVNVLQKGPFIYRQAFIFPRNFKGGIYTPTERVTECKSFYYTSLVVGYGFDTASNSDYWLVKTPFGSAYGDQGFIKIKRSDDNFNYGITCDYAQPRFD